MQDIFDNVKAWLKALAILVIELLMDFISFMRDVVGWFKKKINRLKHLKAVIMAKIVFDRTLNNPATKDVIKEAITNAPVVKVPGLYEDLDDMQQQYVEAVYNEKTDELEALRIIGAHEVDDQFKEFMGKEEIIRLT